jgi:RimJ/RimL family protein N-acetyltransferase
VSLFTEKITLETSRVRLVPTTLEHVSALSIIGKDPSVWAYFTTEQLDEKSMKDWVQLALSERNDKTRYAFTIIEKETGLVAGSTSYLAIALTDSRLEIGSTWMGKDFQGTGLNKHCKFLLFSYGFEKLNLQRIELKTDILNKQSRRAMEKLGAQEEGVLRSHMQMHHDRRRDTVYYSILADEWPEIREKIFGEFDN